MNNPPPLLSTALDLTRIADAEILPRFRNVAVTHKPDGSEVTEADREAEKQMRAYLAERCPGHAILGEEFGASGPDDARYRWILDPIDGTAGFTLGIPLFGTLIGLLEDGAPMLGVIHFPALGETVYAVHGRGCWLCIDDAAPQRVHVAPVDTLAEATASTTTLRSSDAMAADGQVPYRVTTLFRHTGKFRFVTDCLQYALVARGRIHVAFDTIVSPWDVAAIIPCVREAGGVATTLSGSDDVVFGGSILTASSEALADAACDVLRPT